MRRYVQMQWLPEHFIPLFLRTGAQTRPEGPVRSLTHEVHQSMSLGRGNVDVQLDKRLF